MPPLIIAHRGDSACRPENTASAFASALLAGATVIECDVRLTRDGQVAVIHDATLERTTDGNGPVLACSLAELRALSAGYAQRFGTAFAAERIPSLAETLAFLRGRATLLIEIKTDTFAESARRALVRGVVDEVRRARAEAVTACISFDTEALRQCQALAPEIRRGHIFARTTADAMRTAAASAGAELVLPEKGLLSVPLCQALRAAGLKVATWVVDEPEELAALAGYDLYGVGSNRPGPLLAALAGSDPTVAGNRPNCL